MSIVKMSIIYKLAPLLKHQHWLIFEKQKVCSVAFLNVVRNRAFSEKKAENKVAKARPKSDISTDVRPLGEKIKETTKTVSYMGVILVGVGVTGIIFYYVFRELFSSKSPNSIYSAALEKCKEDPYVADALGEPIKGYGEETTRRRRTRVSHAFYQRDGVNCVRMQFYVRGSRKEATVHLDMKEVDGGNFEYRYLFVQLNDYSRKVIVLEDNRASIDKKPFSADQLQPLPSIL